MPEAYDSNELCEILGQSFNIDELKALCLELDVDYENLGGDAKLGKVVELVKYFERRDRLSKLGDAVRRHRPDAFESRAGLHGIVQSSHIPPGFAPPLPKLFVGREKDIAELQRRFTDKPNPTLLIVVYGWPGIGKTSLAATIAHDTRLYDVFPDGVLWTALGQQPNVAVQLGNWLTALGLARRDLPAPKDRSNRLAAILQHKKMLLIVDDVWEIAHAQPFLVGGRDCRTLITTREPQVPRALGLPKQAIYKLSELSQEEALRLLQELAPDAVALDLEGARRLTQELEGLPLALHVAGRLLAAEVAMHVSISMLLDELAEGTRLLKEQAPADRTDLATQTTPTITALLQNSTNRLDSITRDRFALLGHFVSKPATFDAQAVAAVWGEADPWPTLRELERRGLVESAQGRYQMHALLAVHARSMWEMSARGGHHGRWGSGGMGAVRRPVRDSPWNMLLMRFSGWLKSGRSSRPR